MPIVNCPFTAGRPFLPLRIINPHTGKAHRAVGIVDTGADQCAVPAFVAKIPGHDLSAGKIKHIKTGARGSGLVSWLFSFPSLSDKVST